MTDAIRETVYAEPLDGGVSCRYCGDVIVAVARAISWLELKGINDYRWVHRDSGSPTCTLTYEARPYDGWDATRRIESALRTRLRELAELEQER